MTAGGRTELISNQTWSLHPEELTKFSRKFLRLWTFWTLWNVLEFSFYQKDYFARWFVVSLLCSEWSEWEPGAHIDLISPWCYFLSSLSSTILLNNSSRPDKKRRNNTRTSQKQMRSHNTRAITRRDGHFLCSVSNSFSKIGLFKYRRWHFSWKKCFYVWNLLILVKLRENYPNIKGRLRILKIIFKKMHFAVKLSVPVAVLFTLIDYCWLWQIFWRFPENCRIQCTDKRRWLSDCRRGTLIIEFRNKWE